MKVLLFFAGFFATVLGTYQSYYGSYGHVPEVSHVPLHYYYDVPAPLPVPVQIVHEPVKIIKTIQYYIPPPTTTTTTTTPRPNDYFKEVKALTNLAQVALTDITYIAVHDNKEVGAKIALQLQDDINEIDKIFWDYKNKVKREEAERRGRRKKRDAKSDADDTMNKIGQVMIDSNDKIGKDKDKLSPEAQEKMDGKLEDAVNNCKAEVCKSHSEKLKRAKAAKAKKG